uniref:J domain-containing protein n=1 Tax=Onchocerca volvulus TaxID=6282 RepID=A0A8R1XY09_ONCVO
MKRNHYDVLGIPYDATDEEIKNAFVKKSLELHPDGKNFNPEMVRSIDKYAPDLTEQFVQLKMAYDILRRPIRRKQYDQMMGIERLKRFSRRPEKLNLYDMETKQQSFLRNFGMSAREFVNRDFYVRLADNSDNSLMYFTVGGLIVVLILQKLYVWYLESTNDEKSDIKTERKVCDIKI